METTTGTARDMTAARSEARGVFRLTRRQPRRRRTGLVAVAVVLVGVGSLVGVLVVHRLDERRPVLAVMRTVPVGHRIEAGDVRAVLVNADAWLDLVPASELGRVVGRTAAVELREGSLLTGGALTDQAVPGQGEVLVGLPVHTGQMPGRGLHAGDRVMVVATRNSPDATVPAAVSDATGVAVHVFGVGRPDAEGVATVDVIAARADAVLLARMSSAEHLALVLLPPGH